MEGVEDGRRKDFAFSKVASSSSARERPCPSTSHPALHPAPEGNGMPSPLTSPSAHLLGSRPPRQAEVTRPREQP